MRLVSEIARPKIIGIRASFALFTALVAAVFWGLSAEAARPPVLDLEGAPSWFEPLRRLNKHRLNEVRLLKAHNTYEPNRWNGLAEALQFANVVELDVWPMASRRDLWVSHGRPENSNNCRGSRGRVDGGFSDCLYDLAKWSDSHPDHPAVVVNVDFKSGWRGMEEKFDSIVRRALGARLYQPKELRGTHPDLSSSVGATGWPPLDSLRGKFVLILTGGPLGLRNQHLRRYVETRYVKQEYRAAAFICPDIQRGDLTSPNGEIPGIGRQQSHVACVNHDRADVSKLETASRAWRKLLVLGFGYEETEAAAALVENRGVGIVAKDSLRAPGPFLNAIGLRFRGAED